MDWWCCSTALPNLWRAHCKPLGMWICGPAFPLKGRQKNCLWGLIPMSFRCLMPDIIHGTNPLTKRDSKIASKTFHSRVLNVTDQKKTNPSFGFASSFRLFHDFSSSFRLCQLPRGRSSFLLSLCLGLSNFCKFRGIKKRSGAGEARMFLHW